MKICLSLSSDVDLVSLQAVGGRYQPSSHISAVRIKQLSVEQSELIHVDLL